MVEKLIVVGSIIISGIYLIRMGYKTLFSKGGCGCSECPVKDKK